MKPAGETVKRVLTAAALVLLVVGATVSPRPVGASLLALAFARAAWEWSWLFLAARFQRGLYALGIVGVAAGARWLAAASGPLPLLWVGLGWWLVALVLILRFPVRIPAAATAAIGPFVLVPPWLALDALLRGDEGRLVLAVFVLVVGVADSGAWATGRFLAGRVLPRTPLLRTVSPKKTWEGVAGGLVAAALAAWAAGFVLEVPPPGLVLVGLATALASILGDLTVSLFKRNKGPDAKDFPVLLPGHGGLLDRIDGWTAAAPVFALGLALL